jgi:SPW repeat
MANATLGRPNEYSSYSQEKLASSLNVIAGLWLIISPWVLHDQTQQVYTNNVILGIIIAVLAAIRAGGAYRAAWLSWINLLLGLWVIISPWVLQFPASQTQAFWNNVIVGVIVAILAIWSVVATRSAMPVSQR